MNSFLSTHLKSMNEIYVLNLINFIYFFDHLVISISNWFYLAEYVAIETLVEFYGFQLLCFEALLRVSSELVLYWKRFFVNYLRFLMLSSGILGIVLNLAYFMRPPIAVLILTRVLCAFQFFAVNLFNDSLMEKYTSTERSKIMITKRVIQCISTVSAGIVTVVFHFLSVDSNVVKIRFTNIMGIVLAFFWLVYTITVCVCFSPCRNQCDDNTMDTVSDFREEYEKIFLNNNINLTRKNLFSIFSLISVMGLVLSVSTRLTLNLILAPIASVVYNLSPFYVSLIFLGLSICNVLIFPLLKVTVDLINNGIKLVIFTFFIVLGFVMLSLALLMIRFKIASWAICTGVFITGYALTNVAQSGCHLLLQYMVVLDVSQMEQAMINRARRSFLCVGCMLGILLGPGLLVWPMIIYSVFALFWTAILVGSFVFYEGNRKGVFVKNPKK